MLSFCLFSVFLLGLFFSVRDARGTELQEKILQTFYPYRQGVPQVEGIAPGSKIDKSNWQVVEKVLPPEVLKVIQAGELEITVQETTDIPVREEYIAATIKHAAQVQLGEDGEPKGYVAGLPFPLLNSSDPQAGFKAAWNHRYRDGGDTRQVWSTVASRNSAGAEERAVETYYAQMYGVHRATSARNVPEWEKEGIFYKEYLLTLSPLDLEGAQTVQYRYDRDLDADEVWAYDPRTRRSRKRAFNPLEASLGLTFIWEDRTGGFGGYIHPHTWRFVGEEVVLVPGIIKGDTPHFGGKGNWYPVDPWELRKAVVVEAIPKDSGHPYGRRLLYLDKQTYGVLCALAYDHKGRHYRTAFQLFSDPDFNSWNPGTRVPIHIGTAWIDYQADRATVNVNRKVVYDEPLSPRIFTIEEMLRKGK